MDIRFSKIHIHHFLSFGDSEIDLRDRGYCLVSGVNRNPKDAAKSNGSGKSTIWNAICYALTGETIQGLKSNLPNIAFDDGCWVSLEFEADGHSYSIVRSKDDAKLGTNLRIEVDGVDRSGKGLRESEQALEGLLPDITSELLGSVIILGQGLPQRFTNNTPSKRKEVLEHLSKSDFMIQDLKDRVSAREAELSKRARSISERIVSSESRLSVYSEQLAKEEAELESACAEVDFDGQLAELNGQLSSVVSALSDIESDIVKSSASVSKLAESFSSMSSKRQAAMDKVREQHDEATRSFNARSVELASEISSLEREISRLKSITDVCPTCGQKIPGKIKPDTSVQEARLSELKGKRSELDAEISEDSAEYRDVLREISEKFNADIEEAQAKLSKARAEDSALNARKLELTRKEAEVNASIKQVWTLKSNHEQNKLKIEKSIRDLRGKIDSLSKEKDGLSKERSEVSERMDVVSKMSTYLKRDFRGFLLTNVIEYISNKAMDYCSRIFGSDEIVFALSGNNIDISYCGKDYENLSGGEKQRVDLIIQFAIRDMMCNYLGFSSNILVLDEITDNLDSVSCDKVLSFITNELSSVESVFIISHHSDELELPCDSEIVVEKGEDGVSEVRPA